MNSAGVHLMQFFCAVFGAVLFLQSGLDKVLDWSGNKTYLRGYFEKSPLRHFLGFQLFVITALEMLAGICSAAGALTLLFGGRPGLAIVGALAGMVTILLLFFGQRVAKDYAGAASMTGYFLSLLVSVGVLAGLD